MTTATTTLGTNLTFTVLDMQGKNRFPMGAEGLVYRCQVRLVNPSILRKWAETYYIRTGETSFEGRPWRIDKASVVAGGPFEAVYAEDRTSHWASPEDAAQVLAAALVGFNISQ